MTRTAANGAAPFRLSALIVNYRSGAYAVECVRSLRAEWAREAWPAEALEIVVVDNASPSDERASFAVLAALGARVVHAPSNGGYASGMNLALAMTRAGDAAAPRALSLAHSHAHACDALAVVNPDVVFLGGSLRPLLERLRDDPTCGVVGPRVWFDESKSLQLPPIPDPTPWEHAAAALASCSVAFARRRARQRAATARSWWTCASPRDARMLSGACLFLRRDVVPRIGGLFDERFPLYFEDADLCRRVRAAGLRVVHEPAAEIVHRWSRSAGHGAAFAAEPLTRYHQSRAAFMRKHGGLLGRALEWSSTTLTRAWPRRRLGRALTRLEELGTCAAAPRLDVRAHDCTFEYALEPTFTLAAGASSSDGAHMLPSATWEWLFPARYFVRALASDGRTLRAWSFTKVSAAREAVLDDVHTVVHADVHAREPAVLAHAHHTTTRRVA